MNITCESCNATYRIPEEKITREMFRATCKRCGTAMLIRYDGRGRLVQVGDADLEEEVVHHTEDSTVITQVPELKEFHATPAFGLAGQPGVAVRKVAAVALPPQDLAREARSQLEEQLFSAPSGSFCVTDVDEEELDSVEITAVAAAPASSTPNGAEPMNSAGVGETTTVGASRADAGNGRAKAAAQTPPGRLVADGSGPSKAARAAAAHAKLEAEAKALEERRASARKKAKEQSKKGVAAATSMHLGVTAQYEGMVRRGLPPGFQAGQERGETKSDKRPAAPSAAASRPHAEKSAIRGMATRVVTRSIGAVAVLGLLALLFEKI